MSLAVLAFLLLTHFGLILASLAFASETCTVDDLAACAQGGGGIDEERIEADIDREAERLTGGQGGNIFTAAFDFVAGAWGIVTGLMTTLFGMFTFGYPIIERVDGEVGSGTVGLLLIFFRTGTSLLQAFVIYKVGMGALGRG